MSIAESFPAHASQLLVEENSSISDILGRPFRIFSKFVKVFELYFVATKDCPNERLLHGASVLYQYIDNDDDGIPDNEQVYKQLVNAKATMIMFRDDDELESHNRFFREADRLDMVLQDLQADETRPGSCIPQKFDASLEECFHLVTVGYSLAYPDIFGTQPGSSVANAMDYARGGHFKKVPKRYPGHAWFTYYDKTCKYEGMIVEYIYWAMTSILGGQNHRKKEIEDEWRHCCKQSVQENDSAIFALLTDPKYKFPTKLPVPLQCLTLYENASSSGSDDESSEDEKKKSISKMVTDFFSKKK